MRKTQSKKIFQRFNGNAYSIVKHCDMLWFNDACRSERPQTGSDVVSYIFKDGSQLTVSVEARSVRGGQS